MSSDSQIARVTRSRAIRSASIAAIRNSGLNILKFASRVAERYLATVPPLERCVDFYEPGHTIESAARAELANGKLVDRFLKGVVRFPADLEEAWIDALPEPHRDDLVRELAGRYGLAGAKLPTTAHAHLARLSDVLADAGRTAQSLAPMFESGRLDVHGESGAHVARSLAIIDRALADLISLKEQVKAQLPEAAKPAKRRR